MRRARRGTSWALGLIALSTIAAGRQLTLDLDAFNALNTNVAYSATYAAGPSFGYVTRISPPRVVRFGAAFQF